MLKIVQITSNPKRKKRMAKHRKKKISKKIVVKITKKKRKRKIIRVRKNPPTLTNEQKAFLARRGKKKRHDTIIVGYSVRSKFYTRGGRRKSARWYFTGDRFSKHEYDAKRFAGDGARAEARRILPMLPYGIYEIRVENA